MCKRRSFQNRWLQHFEWLAYSDIDISQGAFCKTCVIFSTKAGCGKWSYQSLKSLISSPFTNWKDAIEVFKNNSSTGYHQDCTAKAQNFLEIREGKRASIIIKLDSKASEDAENIKAKLRVIVETIILCGQDILLRADSNGGRLTLDEPEKNDGNFRALLRFRANGGDQDLSGNDEKGISSSLHQRLCTFQFLIGLYVSDFFLCHTYHLSEYLQSVYVDLNVAIEHVDLTISRLT
ncbi:hypothetical protein PR048_014373 [Dryococelus australis]|uniref:TTF-type domain-containing protein n=1 Tax=Dryococelus australis TaxID=614101 RepID=A0ABQ9HE96_9NEOP|nr:hypothetical protein PR048_014373 [Dryococelus australis]